MQAKIKRVTVTSAEISLEESDIRNIISIMKLVIAIYTDNFGHCDSDEEVYNEINAMVNEDMTKMARELLSQISNK